MRLCHKCQRKRRIRTILIKIKKREYWVHKCLECDTPIEMDLKEEAPPPK